MTTFKVGDRVRIVNDDFCYGHVGKTGVIRVDDLSGLPYLVKFDDGHTTNEWFRPQDLKLVTPVPTVYKLQVPAEPEGVTRVRPVCDPSYSFGRTGDGFWSVGLGCPLYTWNELLERYQPDGLEPVPEESEYDAAVRWFRERPEEVEFCGSSENEKHAAAIVRHVVAQHASEGEEK